VAGEHRLQKIDKYKRLRLPVFVMLTGGHDFFL